MARYLFSVLLLMCVALLGVVSHTVMAGGAPTASVPCHHQQAVTHKHVKATADCGLADHSMSTDCAVACVGKIAPWFPPADPAPMAFRPVVHQMPVSLVLHGRLIEIVDRPPKHI